MSFMASSMGRVTVAIISSAGMTPLSARMTTRGKLVCGKTDDGIWMAEKNPARQKAAIIKKMALAWRMAKLPSDAEAGSWFLVPGSSFHVIESRVLYKVVSSQ